MRVIKQPSEKVTFRYEFANELGATSSLASVSGIPTSVARDGGANLTQSGAATIDGTAVLVTWQGGVTGESYLTTAKALDDAGDLHERDGEIFVFDKAFTLPANIDSRYLSGEEFVTRYGYSETVRLTDEDKTQTIDSAKLDAAIKDATEVADAYIGARYTIPLTDVPRLVKSIVAALAREFLYKSRPTPEVTAAADRARSQLKDISAGRIVLPIEAGQSAPVAGGDFSSATSGDGRTSFADAVAEFNLLSGAPVGNWRQ